MIYQAHMHRLTSGRYYTAEIEADSVEDALKVLAAREVNNEHVLELYQVTRQLVYKNPDPPEF